MTTTAPPPYDIGAGIKHARSKAGMTQADLADALGVSRGAIAMWETGQRPIRVDTLLTISDRTATSLAKILDAARAAK